MPSWRNYKSDQDTLEFLAYIISLKGLAMDRPCKVMAITDWMALKDVHGIQSFLGFTNFYRFILGFSALTCPLIALL